MQIIVSWGGDNLHEMSNPSFCKKRSKKKNIVKKNASTYWSSAECAQIVVKVNLFTIAQVL